MSEDQQAGEPRGDTPPATEAARAPAPAEAPAAPEAPPAADPEDGWKPPAKSRLAVVAIALIALAGVLAILYAWQLPPFAGWSEDTDNAYVRGRVTIISPQVSGYVTSVPVRDFATVKQGQILATIDRRIYAARVEQAKANLAAQMAALANSQQAQRAREAALGGQNAAIDSARAQLVKAQADMRRADALVADGSISSRERDQTRAALLAAEAAVRQAQAAQNVGTQDVRSVIVGRGGLEAAVEAARAQLHLAQIDLDNTLIRAPSDGQLSEVGVRNGAYVTAGTQLMFLVPRDFWVIAAFKEAQTHNMRVGQPVTFRVDALGGARLAGHVESLSPAAGSEFAVLKSDNATGNFVKVAQRISVRIRIDPGQSLMQRLRPGMSVEVRVATDQ
ncbi:HlyD family secretion protein [Novosphingobium album (ex Liu et al. 2023)]|uniref:HlyD family secretion protein n=1 Tax=Novosphingobium album (ex Liu et al. 2023) TaxID=3031130 RepID=A0ABT5WLH0_9SPHN|nr:HlyD family secretion protein [Novosphingobium album (ex Liu et al. 2023)]MDE8650890.1 HlyD family secretion protein [Novosphingobium album (ex Liu et al. 2023)]